MPLRILFTVGGNKHGPFVNEYGGGRVYFNNIYCAADIMLFPCTVEPCGDIEFLPKSNVPIFKTK